MSPLPAVARVRSLPAGIAQRITVLLSDPVQGFLAMIAFALAIQHLLFGAAHAFHSINIGVQLLILLLFALEFLAAFYLAPDRKAFLRKPQRILDLVIFSLALLSLLPKVSNLLFHSPALQLLRVIPILFFGYRGTRDIVLPDVHELKKPAETMQGSVYRVSLDAEEPTYEPVSNEEFAAWIANPKRSGCMVTRGAISADQLQALSKHALPPSFIQSALAETSFPRVVRMGESVVLTAAIPHIDESAFEKSVAPGVERAPIIVIATASSLLLVNSSELRLCKMVGDSTSAKDYLPDHPLPARVLMGVFNILLTAYEETAGRIERKIRQWEMEPVRGPEGMLYSKAYGLHRVLSGLKSDLWRLRHIFDRLETEQLRLPFAHHALKPLFTLLSDTCDYLSQTYDHLAEDVGSVLDLRMNLVSFKMNRFMGLLAIVTAAGLIPATISGILGMNIIGTNFQVTLPDVLFWMAVLICLMLYIFHFKGWLRF